MTAGDGSERVANLTRRVEALRKELAEVERRRWDRKPQGTHQWWAAAERSSVKTARIEPPRRFSIAPEIMLAAAAAIALWFLPAERVNGLSTEVTVAVVMLIPILLIAFVLGGAALWRTFRQL
jgi:hypothetical protein